MQTKKYLVLANNLADTAREVIMAKFRQTDTGFVQKDDGSPVTEADKAAESAIRALLAKHVPTHAVWGEEQGRDEGDHEWQWVIDPIDGTRAFATGMPTFCTLIALVHQGDPVLGVIDVPATGERWAGDCNSSSYHDGNRIHQLGTTHPDKTLAAASVAVTKPNPKTDSLLEAAGTNRFGGDAYNFASVASGWLDVAADCNLHPYDYLALMPILTGAGCKFADFAGNQPSAERGDSFIAANSSKLLNAALAELDV